MKFTTVVYHSNDLELIEKADLVIIFKDKKIVEIGQWEEVKNRSSAMLLGDLITSDSRSLTKVELPSSMSVQNNQKYTR